MIAESAVDYEGRIPTTVILQNYIMHNNFCTYIEKKINNERSDVHKGYFQTSSEAITCTRVNCFPFSRLNCRKCILCTA